MKVAAAKVLNNKRETAETKRIESAFKAAEFSNVNVYRYNSVSIRIRVIDFRFTGLSIPEREELVYPTVIEKLTEASQQDITFLLLLAPDELKGKRALLNLEFEDPTPSSL